MKNIQLELILSIVCRHYNVTASELRAPNRENRFVEPRQIFMYVAREVTGLYFDDIAKAINRRQFTTMHACNKIAAQRRIYRSLDAEIKTLMDRISNEPMIILNIDLLKIAEQNTAA